MCAIKTYGQHHLCSCDYRFVCLLFFIRRSVLFEPRSGVRAYIRNAGFSPCMHYVTALACPANQKARNVSVPFCRLTCIAYELYGKGEVWLFKATYFGDLISSLFLCLWGNLQLILHFFLLQNSDSNSYLIGLLTELTLQRISNKCWF